MWAKIFMLGAIVVYLSDLAYAQSSEPVSLLKGHDSGAPVDVDADRLEFHARADRAVFVGNVVVQQAKLTLETQRLTVAYAAAGGVQIDRLDASGGVTVRTPSEIAKANFGIYDLDRKLITLIGNVQLIGNDAEISGARLVIDLNTGYALIDGGTPSVDQRGGRVTGTFTVPERRND